MINNQKETQLNSKIIMVGETDFTDLESYNNGIKSNYANIFKIYNQLSQSDLDRLEMHFRKYNNQN